MQREIPGYQAKLKRWMLWCLPSSAATIKKRLTNVRGNWRVEDRKKLYKEHTSISHGYRLYGMRRREPVGGGGGEERTSVILSAINIYKKKEMEADKKNRWQ